VTVSDRDNGYRRVVASMQNANVPATLTVGIHEDAGTEPDGTTVAQVADWNEFGTGNIPARPFIGGFVEENEAQIEEDLRKCGEEYTRGRDGKLMLTRFGLRYVGLIQQRISSGIAPPNSPVTVARKGSATPLIDTGQLRSSIRSKVE